MKKLTLNKEYAKRHLFALIVMLALSLWFGYDGFIGYPSTSAHELYRSIEKADPPMGMDVEAFKRQKTQTQYGFTFLTLLAAVLIARGLHKSKCFDFAYDDESFIIGGQRHAWSEVKNVDLGSWEKKSIARLELDKNAIITLDGWHHCGVKELVANLPQLTGRPK